MFWQGVAHSYHGEVGESGHDCGVWVAQRTYMVSLENNDDVLACRDE